MKAVLFFVSAVTTAVMADVVDIKGYTRGGSFGGTIGQGLSLPSPPSADSEYGAPVHTPQVFRNVYVFSAPDEAPENHIRTIKVPGGDKHVNIVFVKTPSSSSSHNTEVILPEQDEHKNLVYVLLKKGSNSADVKITRPASRPAPKPEVNFIRYGESGAAGYSGGGSTSGSGPVAIGVGSSFPSSNYGSGF